MANDESNWNIVFQSRVAYATRGTTNLREKKSDIVRDHPFKTSVCFREVGVGCPHCRRLPMLGG